MPGIAEFLAEGSNKLIVAELPDGSVMLTVANTITHERHSITMRAHRGARRRQPVPSTGSDPFRTLALRPTTTESSPSGNHLVWGARIERRSGHTPRNRGVGFDWRNRDETLLFAVDIAISVRRDADMCGLGAIFSTSSR
jgi:hypothetical protein